MRIYIEFTQMKIEVTVMTSGLKEEVQKTSPYDLPKGRRKEGR